LGLAVGLALGLPVLVLLVFYVLAQIPPRVGRDLPRIEASTAAAASFDQKISDADTSSTISGLAPQRWITFTERELTSKLSVLAAELREVRLQDAQIWLRRDTVIATARIGVFWLSARIAIVVAATANPDLRVDLRTLHIGAIPVPDRLRRRINTEITRTVEEERTRRKPEIAGLFITTGEVTVDVTNASTERPSR
jgi:hypothetical protein